jgi:fumarate hydratase class II
MYIATVIEIEEVLVPSASALVRRLDRNSCLSDCHGRRLRAALGRLDEAEGGLHEIGIDGDDNGGGQAITPEEWQTLVATIAAETARLFIAIQDRSFEGELLDPVVAAMAAVRGLAAVVLDIVDASYAPQAAPDRRPRLGAEAASMLCLYVIGQVQLVAIAACRGSSSFLMRPLIVASVLNSVRVLVDACAAVRSVVAQTH